MNASKTPGSIGCTCYWTDPSTWFYHYGAAEPGSQMEPNYECFEHFPHAQHNEPNPILVAYREFEAAHVADTHRLYWLASLDALASFGGYVEWDEHDNPFHSLTTATPAEIDHARRVLERLARMADR